MANLLVIGAGVMGTAITVPAIKNGHDITLVGTPLDKEIIEKKGLTLIKDGIKRSFHFDISENASDLGKQDYIFKTL